VSQEEPDKLSASNGIWHELRFVAPIATEPAASTVESLISGESVIVVPDLVSDAECAALSDEALQAVVKASLVPKCVRLPLMVKSQSRDDVASKGHKQEWSLESRPDQVGSETVTAALTVAADTIGETIFRRVLCFVDEQFPSVARDVFGAGKGAAANLVQMYDEDDLEYASYEPAVNVYGAGGEFEPHKDYHGLTMLVTLSTLDSFSGGGTGFWSREDSADELQEPTLVVKPSRGTVMLFGGQVMHSGMAVDAGVRVVFVGSFSHKWFKPPGGFGELFGDDING